MNKNTLRTYENISLTNDNYATQHRVYISIPSKKNKTKPPKVQIENTLKPSIPNKKYNNNNYFDRVKTKISNLKTNLSKIDFISKI